MSHNTMLCNINKTAHESKKIQYSESPDPDAFIDVYIIGIAPYDFSSILMIYDVIFDEF